MGFCESYCGDGVCAGNENSSECPYDCIPAQETVVFPDDGIPWRNRSSNWPDEDAVNGCFGNCGPGCAQWSICGTPSQYWNLAINGGPSYHTSQRCTCADNYNLLDCGTIETWEAGGTWTYNGWVAQGCYTHDGTCRSSWANITVTVIGIATSVLGWTDWWVPTLFGYGACFDGASFLAGGGCLNAHADQWSYNTYVVANSYSHEFYDYGPPGVCYNGPPACGDGICQTEDCGIILVDAPNQFPGDGCEEEGGSCPSDCS
jgi:hypothetical protein